MERAGKTENFVSKVNWKRKIAALTKTVPRFVNYVINIKGWGEHTPFDSSTPLIGILKELMIRRCVCRAGSGGHKTHEVLDQFLNYKRLLLVSILHPTIVMFDLLPSSKVVWSIWLLVSPLAGVHLPLNQFYYALSLDIRVCGFCFEQAGGHWIAKNTRAKAGRIRPVSSFLPLIYASSMRGVF